MTTLWLRPADRHRLRARLAAGEPTVAGIAALARAQAARPAAEVLVRDPARPAASHLAVLGDRHLAGCAVAALLDDDAAAAGRALAYWLWWTEPWNPSGLGAAAQALHGAVAWECCAPLWTPAGRAAAADRLARLHRGFREINQGNPHAVTNNWWGVTHAGALLAALAAHGEPGADGAAHDLAEGIAWARGRLDAFACHFGDAGLYHEGLGYQGYTASLLLPALLADGAPLLPRHPGLARMGSSLYAAGALLPTVRDDAGADAGPAGFGMALSWNDAGLGWGQDATAAAVLALAPEADRAGLRWMYDRLSGVAGPGCFAPGMAGWFFTLLAYPFDHPAAPDALPRHVRDARQGLVLLRDRYRDGDDCLLGVYAKATHVGGHAQQDAGSVRLIALGHQWIVGGGQARGQRAWQSTCSPLPPAQPDGCGALIWDEPMAGGGAVGIDLRRVSGGYHERYVALHAAGAGAPVALALLDQIDDHLAREWEWTSTFLPGYDGDLHPDGAGFTLRAADGARLDARFLAAKPRTLERREMPGSRRSFSSGGTVAYPGRPFIAATFAPAPRLAIYVAMTVTRGEAPPIALGEGVDLRIGAHRWRRPFGAAVPEAYRPGISGGLCRSPAGVDDFRARPRPG